MQKTLSSQKMSESSTALTVQYDNSITRAGYYSTDLDWELYEADRIYALNLQQEQIDDIWNREATAWYNVRPEIIPPQPSKRGILSFEERQLLKRMYGRVESTTRQPPKGQGKSGLRLGEIERDAIVSQRKGGLLRRMCEQVGLRFGEI